MSLRNELNKQLKFGDKSQIARNIGVSRSTVYAFFSGKVDDFRVLEEVCRLLNHRKQVLNKVKDVLK